MKRNIFKWLGLTFGIFALSVLFLGYVLWHSLTPQIILGGFQFCVDTQTEIQHEEFVFMFSDKDTQEPISCRIVTLYEQNSSCASSPCSRFHPVYRTRTAKDGSAAIPTKYMLNQVFNVGVSAFIDDAKYLFFINDYYKFARHYSTFKEELIENGQYFIQITTGIEESNYWREPF